MSSSCEARVLLDYFLSDDPQRLSWSAGACRIDEIHTLVGAGSAGGRGNSGGGGGMDIANLVKPALARGEFQVKNPYFRPICYPLSSLSLPPNS